MWLLRCLLVALCASISTSSFADDWPSRSVTVIATATPGGAVDIVARVIAKSLSQRFHQTFIVDNRGGAGGTIGTNVVVNSSPDGYTLLLSSNGELTAAPYVQKGLPYDPLKDLAPVVLIASSPQVVVVNPKVPANTMKELIEYARSKGGVGYGTPGFGSSAHVGFELVKAEGNLPFFHIAYKGGGPAVLDLVGGQIEMAVVTLPAISASIEAKLVRPLAVLQPTRSPLLPDVPTITEATGLATRDASTWLALLAPAKTPREILRKLEDETLASLTPEVRAVFGKAMLTTEALPSNEFRSKMTEESEQIEMAIKRAGITPQ